MRDALQDNPRLGDWESPTGLVTRQDEIREGLDPESSMTRQEPDRPGDTHGHAEQRLRGFRQRLHHTGGGEPGTTLCSDFLYLRKNVWAPATLFTSTHVQRVGIHRDPSRGRLGAAEHRPPDGRERQGADRPESICP